MNKKEIEKAIDDLVSFSTRNEKFVDESQQESKSFGVGYLNVSFIGFESVLKFQEALGKLYSFRACLKILVKKYLKVLNQSIFLLLETSPFLY